MGRRPGSGKSSGCQTSSELTGCWFVFGLVGCGWLSVIPVTAEDRGRPCGFGEVKHCNNDVAIALQMHSGGLIANRAVEPVILDWLFTELRLDRTQSCVGVIILCADMD
jgi:hypothetical protein